MRGLVARARVRTCVDQRLQSAEHTHGRAPGAGGAGAPPLVSMVLPHRAWSYRAAAKPARYRTPAMATVVAELAVRRSDVGGDGCQFRQSRLRRRDDPVLSA